MIPFLPVSGLLTQGFIEVIETPDSPAGVRLFAQPVDQVRELGFEIAQGLRVDARAIDGDLPGVVCDRRAAGAL